MPRHCMCGKRISFRKQITFNRNCISVELPHQINSVVRRFVKLFRGTETLLLPFLGGCSDRQAFGHSKLMKVHQTVRDLMDHLKNGLRPVKRILARLKLISSAAKQDVNEGYV